jgi:hypothetical protein
VLAASIINNLEDGNLKYKNQSKLMTLTGKATHSRGMKKSREIGSETVWSVMHKHEMINQQFLPLFV